ncbi:MAG: ABC transporter permease [Deltaproteobacteria bacterium]|nr:ABC transporter permease [Deltaproteobacteria bacterium]
MKTSPLLSSLLAVYTLTNREVVRFLRQRNRVFGALAQPVLFWLIFGQGLSGARFHSVSVGYSEYFFPGIVVLVVLFTAIFATISIIDDRNTGFLQSVLVAPVPTVAIVMGKVAGTMVLAVGQGVLVCALAALGGFEIGLGGLAASLPVLVLLSIALAGVGLMIAWPMDSTQGFHAIMMAFLMPMWLLSGAFFPPGGTPSWLGWIIALNPLTYGVALLRYSLYAAGSPATAGLPPLSFCFVATIAFAAATLGGSVFVARNRAGGRHP